MDRLRLATAWFGGCAGCHMSFLDLDEFLLELATKVELVYSPIVDVKEYPENVALCLVEGAICNTDNLELLRAIRARTKVLAAFGDCAVTANVPAIRNQFGPGNKQNVLQCAYIENACHNRSLPNAAGLLPALLPRVMPLHEVVRVEYFLPGCPPAAAHIKALVGAILAGTEPKLEGIQLKFG
jgi:NAD-reducing hydrogenase small subunit